MNNFWALLMEGFLNFFNQLDLYSILMNEPRCFPSPSEIK